jgi:site-specific DNA recombinase
MRVGIYARKSTEQTGIADGHSSVERQVANARAYADGKGWTVLENQIYIDDGISGGEFLKRPGFLRLMNAVAPRRQFDVLVMSEESRLGREAIETAYALKQMISAGVRVFFYLDDRERTLQGPTDKLLMSVAAFADELERERARQRTYDALSRKAKAGHVTGGRVFGYDNIPITGADGTRTHVERRINEAEAAVVRTIFERATQGEGVRRIALALNAAGAPAPRSQRGRPRAWSPSSVFEVLHRDLYRGAVIWNRSRKRDDWGRTHQQPKTEKDWIQHQDERLRIVTEDAWAAANVRIDARRRAYLASTGGERHGRPAASKPSKYLLTGLVECGQCHGSLVVRTNSRLGKARVPMLACWHYHTRGTTVCDNRTQAALDDVSAVVIDKLAQMLTSPAVLAVAVAVAQDVLGDAMANRDDDVARAADTIAALDAEAGRLVELTAAGVGDMPAVIARLRSIKERRATLERLVVNPSAPAMPTAVELAARIRDRVTAWRDALQGNPAKAKPILEGLLEGRIVVTPVAGTKEFDVKIPFNGEGLLTGVSLPKALASPTGFEPVF